MFRILSIFSWLAFIYGTVFGSFSNVLAYRIPRGESIVFPGSHCPKCNHRLGPFELVPVLSWVGLRGRCRQCKAPISLRYPVMELLTGGLWGLAVYQHHSWSQVIVWLLFWFYLITVVGTDLTDMIVPDVLSLPAAVVVFIGAGVTHIQTWWMALLGMAVGYGMILFIHLVTKGRMGLGDAKLYLSIGAMFGPWLTLESFILACLFGAVIGLGLRRFGRIQKGQYLPFVPYIAMGTVVTAFYGHTLLDAYLRLVLHLPV